MSDIFLFILTMLTSHPGQDEIVIHCLIPLYKVVAFMLAFAVVKN